MTVRVAALLVAVTPLTSVTTARYSGEPAVAKSLRVKVGVVEPVMPGPSLRLVNVLPLSVETCHCTLSGPLPPLSAMVKDSAVGLAGEGGFVLRLGGDAGRPR